MKRKVAVVLARGGRLRRPQAREPRKQTTWRKVLELAWPIAAAMAGETVLGLVDAKLVGGLGAAALGGVGVGMTLMFLGYVTTMGTLRAVKVRTANAVGEGSPELGIRYAQIGLAIAAVMGIAMWIVARDASWLFSRIGAAPELVPYARDFVAAVTWGAPGAFVVCALTQHRQALNDARTPMIVGIAGNAFNAVMAWTLIYGHFGAPALGVRGAGYATATTEWLEAIAMLIVFARDARASKAPGIGLREAMRDVLAIGIPTGAQFGAELLAFSTFTAILGSLGATQIAAHQASLAIIRTSFLPGIAIGEAASVLVGQAVGARRLDEADRVTRASVVIAVVFMAACGVVFALFGGAIARAMVTGDDVVEVVRELLLIAAVFQVLDAFNIVLRGALRGAKDVRVPAIMGISIVWTCVPGAAFLLGKLAGMGAAGGWCGFIGETLFATILFSLRWRRGAWRRAVTT